MSAKAETPGPVRFPACSKRCAYNHSIDNQSAIIWGVYVVPQGSVAILETVDARNRHVNGSDLSYCTGLEAARRCKRHRYMILRSLCF